MAKICTELVVILFDSFDALAIGLSAIGLRRAWLLAWPCRSRTRWKLPSTDLLIRLLSKLPTWRRHNQQLGDIPQSTGLPINRATTPLPTLGRKISSTILLEVRIHDQIRPMRHCGHWCKIRREKDCSSKRTHRFVVCSCNCSLQYYIF